MLPSRSSTQSIFNEGTILQANAARKRDKLRVDAAGFKLLVSHLDWAQKQVISTKAPQNGTQRQVYFPKLFWLAKRAVSTGLVIKTRDG